MPSIHPTAAQGFAASAEAYDAGRPGYPADAVRHLLELLPPRAELLDLAAGTGKLTRPLLEAGARVTAVEPVAQMRAALPRGARVLAGTAEAIPVEAAAVDAVAVGQAFHWFDGDAALAEIQRVLRPGGLLALLWNRRVEDDPVNRAIEALLAPHRRGVPSHRGDGWRAAFERSKRFEPLAQRAFANEQLLDADGLEARVGSISFVATLPRAERDRLLERARALGADGPVRVPYRTDVQTWRAATIPPWSSESA